MANFVLKFLHCRYHGNSGRSDVNFNMVLYCLTSKPPVWSIFLAVSLLLVVDLEVFLFRPL